jgi:orotidine-5'-phosphate decarboxylase
MGKATGQATEVAVALDGMSLDEASDFVERLGDDCTWVKVGLELYTRSGPAAVRRFKDRGCQVFLDLKLHDIPNTVAGSVRAAAELGADLLTIHASGGEAMMQAARAAVDEAESDLRLLAVTVLTSIDADALSQSWGLESPPQISEQVERLAQLAVAAGAHGLVCSALEAALLRRTLGAEPLLVTPGIRLRGDAASDQSRVASPAEAAAAGADLLVVGRSITQAEDPRAALRRVRGELVGVVA